MKKSENQFAYRLLSLISSLKINQNNRYIQITIQSGWRMAASWLRTFLRGGIWAVMLLRRLITARMLLKKDRCMKPNSLLRTHAPTS